MTHDAQPAVPEDLQSLYECCPPRRDQEWILGRSEIRQLIERIAKAEAEAATQSARADTGQAARDVMSQEMERMREDWETIRDAVLNERFGLAEAGLTSDQVNAVLGIIDDYAPTPASRN